MGKELVGFERHLSLRKAGGNHCHINAIAVAPDAAKSAKQVQQAGMVERGVVSIWSTLQQKALGVAQPWVFRLWNKSPPTVLPQYFAPPVDGAQESLQGYGCREHLKEVMLAQLSPWPDHKTARAGHACSGPRVMCGLSSFQHPQTVLLSS
jgi:hypothetical protein